MAPVSRRVLVVDDDVDIADSLAALLRLSGHRVFTARDGVAAISVALTSFPEFVFLDIGLPGLDGFAVARRLRAEPALRGARIYAVTARDDEEARRSAARWGFDDYFVKPIAPRALESLLVPPTPFALVD